MVLTKRGKCFQNIPTGRMSPQCFLVFASRKKLFPEAKKKKKQQLILFYSIQLILHALIIIQDASVLLILALWSCSPRTLIAQWIEVDHSLDFGDVELLFFPHLHIYYCASSYHTIKN